MRQSHLISKDDRLKSICVGVAEGRFYLDGQSGEPAHDFAYAKLIEHGNTGLVLGGWGDRWERAVVFKPHLQTYLTHVGVKMYSRPEKPQTY